MSDRRLIEERLPLIEVNAASDREKSLRYGHISTMHLWWARRPLAQSRAIVFGTLLPNPRDTEERDRVLKELANAAEFERSVASEVIEPLRHRLAEAYPDSPPKVLDCFAGGGAIPLEALRLGCHVTALDLNPVAYLIEKCILEYPQRFGTRASDGSRRNTLASDFVYWAGWVRDQVAPKLAKVFPTDKHGRRPAIYFWARTMRCPNPVCQAEIPLLKSRWLIRDSPEITWLAFDAQRGIIRVSVRAEAPPEGEDPSLGTVRASSVTCPACGNSVRAVEVRSYGQKIGFGERLLAVLDIIKIGKQSKRRFRDPTTEEESGQKVQVDSLLGESDDLADGTSALPDERMIKSQSRRYSNLTYGIDTFRGLFSSRQVYVIGQLCEAVREAHATMLKQEVPADRARVIATYLGLCVDRIADRNSSFCSWDLSRSSVRNTFPQQSIRMTWDYIEINPLEKVSGGWDNAVRWIDLAIRHCSSTGSTPATVLRGDAQQLPFLDNAFDAVIVDPPYYDAFQYGDLSDFFYVWLKRSVGHLYPELFPTPLTPKQQEIIESRAHRDSPEYISHEEFERRLQCALVELERVVRKPDGIVSIIFAHTDVEAWERLLRALRIAGLIISTSWPMRSEMSNRSTAQISAVLDSSVVLVCRPWRPVEEGFYDDVVRELEARLAERLPVFEEMELTGADYFVSAVGPAFEVFARYTDVVKLSGEPVGVDELMVLARKAVARYAMRRLLGEDSLTALDADSLFYLTWRWAYLTAPIDADEAYKLERALDVDLDRLTRPGGMVRQKGSNFWLLGPHERDALTLGVAPPLVDVLHHACRLWEAGRRDELEKVLGGTGMGVEPSFWATARALQELLPEGSKERTMLLGLTGDQERLKGAAAKHAPGSHDPRLFDLDAR